MILHCQNINVLAPNPPVILSLTTINSQSVHVTWRAPTQPNGVLINYTITYTTDANSSEATVPYIGNVSNLELNGSMCPCLPFI